MKIKSKSIMYGIFAAVLVLLINFIILYSLDFPRMAIQIIGKYWILLVLLIGGFGVQVGLYIYHKSLLSYSTTVASGAISGVSMVLCCSHYLLNVLPFIGVAAGLSFLAALSDYTLYFLILGVISNAVGIGIMTRQINRHNKKFIGGKK